MANTTNNVTLDVKNIFAEVKVSDKLSLTDAISQLEAQIEAFESDDNNVLFKAKGLRRNVEFVLTGVKVATSDRKNDSDEVVGKNGRLVFTTNKGYEPGCKYFDVAQDAKSLLEFVESHKNDSFTCDKAQKSEMKDGIVVQNADYEFSCNKGGAVAMAKNS